MPVHTTVMVVPAFVEQPTSPTTNGTLQNFSGENKWFMYLNETN